MTRPLTVAVVHNADWTLYLFRASLMRALKARGCRVLAIAPAGRAVESIERDGIVFVDWPLARRNLKNPFPEILSVVRLWSIYRRTKPDLVHHYYLKTNIYGAIAARLAGVKVVITSVNGLGYIFTAKSASATLLRPIILALYRLAFALSDVIIFQNQDDIDTLKAGRLVRQGKARLMPSGSGVDLTVFDARAVDDARDGHLRESLGIPKGGAIVMLVGRMLWDKGIAEFVECSRRVRRTVDAQFVLVGPVDPGNPNAIPGEVLQEWHREGVIHYLGERDNIPELMALSDVLVLPSYREGMSRTLMEGAAMGKAMVTTDVPGCREIVQHGVSGLLVPPRNSAALAEAVEELLLSPDLRNRLSDAARETALREFDEHTVVARLLLLYDTALGNKGLETLPAEAVPSTSSDRSAVSSGG